MNPQQIEKLIRREKKRQAIRRHRPWFPDASDWFRAAIDELFSNLPRLRENKQGRAKQYVRDDLRWHLAYLKGKRLGYEIEVD